MSTTIQTSNGPLALSATVALRGAPIELTEVVQLERREGEYTHAVGYWDAERMVAGSTLIREEDVDAVIQHLAKVTP